MRLNRRHLLCAALPLPAWGADAYAGPLFDAHLHVNVEALEGPHPLPDMLGRIARAGVRGVLANSRPNAGTRALAAAAPSALQVVPFVRLYRDRADYATWPHNPEIAAMVREELAQPTAVGALRGIGEGHLYDAADADGRTVRDLAALARERGLTLFLHCDDAALERVFAHTPGVRLLWAHSGISGVPVARVAALLARHPTLQGELSYRPGLTDDDGRLSPEWRALLMRQGTRFLIGSDTWTPSRWPHYEALMQACRRWLGDLPVDVGQAVAWGNAARAFGLRGPG